MCNLYSMKKSRSEVVAISNALRDRNHNSPLLPGIYPDYSAPVVTNGADGREVRDLRWGMPSSKKAILENASKRADKLRAKGEEIDADRFKHMLRMEPDGGTTNIRNTSSPHWKPYLGPANRCLVPFTSFSEPDQVGGSRKAMWFAIAEDQPLAFFAGVWTPDYTCVRKIKEGEVCADLYGFLTTTANSEVARFHDKAMPVILTEPEEWDLWLSDASWLEVSHLQRPLPDGALQLVDAPQKPEQSSLL